MASADDRNYRVQGNVRSGTTKWFSTSEAAHEYAVEQTEELGHLHWVEDADGNWVMPPNLPRSPKRTR